MKNLKEKLVETFVKLRQFLKETRSEMKKVIWPDRKYVVTATLIVIFIVFVFSVFTMFVDYVFSKIFLYFFK